jgi:hypothetical protein
MKKPVMLISPMVRAITILPSGIPVENKRWFLNLIIISVFRRVKLMTLKWAMGKGK